MPSISHLSDRHTIIDKRAGHYLSFPDIVRAEDGRLIVAYREAEKHVATRSKLLYKTSQDGGATWSAPRILNAVSGHCPRATRLSDGQLVIIDDASRSLYWSLDNGVSWAQQPDTGLQHGIPDRLLELGPETFLTVAQNSRGAEPASSMAQTPHENMAYISENRGRNWRPLSVVASDAYLALCETSVTRLPDGRLLALMRENSCVCEPLYMSLSSDEGKSWSEPAPTPIIGHRPCVGMTASDRILVTYRNVAPMRGTAAWLGTLAELGQDFMVHGVTLSDRTPSLADDGLHIDVGPDEPSLVRYALRPLTEPEHAHAELCVELKVDHADVNGCGILFGTWWRIFPDHVRADHVEGHIPLPTRQFNKLRLVYDKGVVALHVNDEPKAECAVNGRHRDTRQVMIGNVAAAQPCEPAEKAAQSSVWKSIRYSTSEPRRLRDYEWTWTPADGLPDRQAQERVLELKNDLFASWGDMGYSGWLQQPGGEILCAYHHGGYREPGYTLGASAHVMLTRFSEEDFGG